MSFHILPADLVNFLYVEVAAKQCRLMMYNKQIEYGRAPKSCWNTVCCDIHAL